MIEINTMEELLDKLSFFSKENYLYRGQIKNYSDGNYEYSFQTSFDRVRCIPYYQIKWQYYCNLILDIMTNEKWINNIVEINRLKYVEALMQHYGWRSRFIDLTSNPLVSIFFACYTFSKKTVMYAMEDCYENFLIEVKNEATYNVGDNEYGYLYAINHEKLASKYPNMLINLKEGLVYTDLRPVRQAGYLLENCDGKLNSVMSECIVEVLKIDKNVLLECCHLNNITVKWLFPSNEIDFIYNMLLSMPRKEYVFDGIGSNFFQKPLIIPEYNIEFRKFQVPEVAYYSQYWTRDIVDQNINFLKYQNSREYRCKDDFIFHILPSIDNRMECKELLETLLEHNSILIEFDNIFQGYFIEEDVYQKAIYIEKEEDIISFSEIGVQVNGRVKRGIVSFPSIYFRNIDNTYLEYVKHEDKCKCGNMKRQFHSVSIAIALFKGLKEGVFVEDSINEDICILDIAK